MSCVVVSGKGSRSNSKENEMGSVSRGWLQGERTLGFSVLVCASSCWLG